MILHYGKMQNQVNQNGNLHGEKVVQGGTLNVQQWQKQDLKKALSTCTLAVKT